MHYLFSQFDWEGGGEEFGVKGWVPCPHKAKMTILHSNKLLWYNSFISERSCGTASLWSCDSHVTKKTSTMCAA